MILIMDHVLLHDPFFISDDNKGAIRRLLTDLKKLKVNPRNHVNPVIYMDDEAYVKLLLQSDEYAHG